MRRDVDRDTLRMSIFPCCQMCFHGRCYPILPSQCFTMCVHGRTYLCICVCGSKVGSIVFGCTQFISAGSPVPQTRTQWSQWSCPLFQQSITAVLKYSLQDSWTRTVFSCLWLSVQLSFMPAPHCFDWMENHIYEQRWSRREVARVPHLSTGCRRGFKFCLTNLPSVCTHCW